MPGPNLLIGNGQVLAGPIVREPGGGGKKQYPYTIQEARDRLGPGLAEILAVFDDLPEAAKPRGEATSVVTVHPAFQAKTQMPAEVFVRAGLRAVGSRPAKVTPAKDARKTAADTDEQPTAEIYVTGNAAAFRTLLDLLMSTQTGKGVQQEFCKLEAVRALEPEERILRLEGADINIPIEIVLHGEGSDDELLGSLLRYSSDCNAKVFLAKRLSVPGLVFMPGIVPRENLSEFAKFTALRAVRRLPVIRLNRPVIRQKLTVQAPALPKEEALDPGLRVVALDGGLGAKDFGVSSFSVQ